MAHGNGGWTGGLTKKRRANAEEARTMRIRAGGNTRQWATERCPHPRCGKLVLKMADCDRRDGITYGMLMCPAGHFWEWRVPEREPTPVEKE